jgi:hypothetical protein
LVTAYQRAKNFERENKIPPVGKYLAVKNETWAQQTVGRKGHPHPSQCGCIDFLKSTWGSWNAYIQKLRKLGKGKRIESTSWEIKAQPSPIDNLINTPLRSWAYWR